MQLQAMPCVVYPHARFAANAYVKLDAGGDLKFAYGIDKVGVPTWVNLTDQTDKWLSAFRQDDSLPQRKWVRPTAELGPLSFTAKFVDAMIAGQLTSCPGNWQFYSLCNTPISNLTIAGMSGTLGSMSHYDACCRTVSTQQPARDTKQPYNVFRDRELADLGNTYQSYCTDAVTSEFLILQGFNKINIVFASLADAMDGGDGTCPRGCLDHLRPLCKAGSCVMPTCADMSQHCNHNTKAGTRARFWCPS